MEKEKIIENEVIKADLLLVHPPAFFDFRNQDKVYFPFLSTSGDVPITPLYEYFPMGFKTLKRYLGSKGHDIKILNLSSLLLKYPTIDLETILKKIDVKVIGIDLHWMIHVQGSIEIAALMKKLHPNTYIMLGGISSTYFADELITYSSIDMVMRGYDTHEPMEALLNALKSESDFDSVPNLLWKKRTGEVIDNGFSYKPKTFSFGIDWLDTPRKDNNELLQIREMLSTSNAGCAYNCGWCGGSRDAFQRVNKCDHTVAYKDLNEIKYEFDNMEGIVNIDKYHYYSCGSYNETGERMDYFLDRVANLKLKSISYEQYFLTPENILNKMSKANNRTVITLSPESHDTKVSKLAGRGVYTMDEMERWIEKALEVGIYEIDIWFFIGMPEQDEKSVFETVEYCHRLMERFKGQRVIPLLCPMIPFLDPGSNFFTSPEKYGYNVFYRTVEEHRRGMMRASIINRLNYETKWLNRSELVYVGYEAVRRLFEIKACTGLLPKSIVDDVVRKIDDAREFTKVVHEVDCITDERVRSVELSKLGSEILQRNKEVFFSGVQNQTFPLNRQIGGRWFDEMLFYIE